MKKVVSILAALVLLLTVSAAAAEGMLLGGWEIVESEAGELPEEVQKAFDKALDGLVGALYVPVKLLAQQVVAGMNYCILCQITPVVPDARPTWALVYIYADLEGNATLSNVYELYIAMHSQREE